MDAVFCNPPDLFPDQPCWSGYRIRLHEILEQWPMAGFPSVSFLQQWLPAGVTNARGNLIRFVAADQLPGVDYERHIYETGEVSTRSRNWHDVFNAMVWGRFPALKSALNACHYRELPGDGSKKRSRLRDALTLLDESGAVVCSTSMELLESLQGRDWKAAFQFYQADWAETRTLVCGHALLEKFPRPYKSITAKVILLHTRSMQSEAQLDRWLMQRLLQGELFNDPSGLSPLPLMGIPGWWTASIQDDAFYADPGVFRAPSPAFSRPQIHRMD